MAALSEGIIGMSATRGTHRCMARRWTATDGDSSEVKAAAWLGSTAAVALRRVAELAKGRTRLVPSSRSRAVPTANGGSGYSSGAVRLEREVAAGNARAEAARVLRAVAADGT